ncbi:hypothetical protein FQN49_004296 [Arthroderma sp. PD_2]|nr:hypothetical protein FQN49_004296 [Arthroderma sp. PD_2]
MKLLSLIGALFALIAGIAALTPESDAERLHQAGVKFGPNTRFYDRVLRKGWKYKIQETVQKTITYHSDELDYTCWQKMEPKVTPGCDRVTTIYKEYKGFALEYLQKAQKLSCTLKGRGTPAYKAKIPGFKDATFDYELGVEEYAKRFTQYCPGNAADIKTYSDEIIAALKALTTEYAKDECTK